MFRSVKGAGGGASGAGFTEAGVERNALVVEAGFELVGLGRLQELTKVLA